MNNLTRRYVQKVPPTLRVVISVSVFFIAYFVTRALVR